MPALVLGPHLPRTIVYLEDHLGNAMLHSNQRVLFPGVYWCPEISVRQALDFQELKWCAVVLCACAIGPLDRDFTLFILASVPELVCDCKPQLL